MNWIAKLKTISFSTKAKRLLFCFCFLAAVFGVACSIYLLTRSPSYTIQILDKNIVANHVGGIMYSPSCFVPNTVEKKNFCAPQFIIAGTMKGGTTSLYTYLQHHPLVLPLENTDVKVKGKTKEFTISAMGDKEIRFFNREVYSRLTDEIPTNKYMDTYLSFFPKISSQSNEYPNYREGYITGEASPTYLVSYYIIIMR